MSSRVDTRKRHFLGQRPLRLFYLYGGIRTHCCRGKGRCTPFWPSGRYSCGDSTIRVVSLFFKPSMKLAFVTPCMHLWYRVWLARVPRSTANAWRWSNQHEEASTSMSPCNGPIDCVFGTSGCRGILSPQGHWVTLVSLGGCTRDFVLHGGHLCSDFANLDRRLIF